MNRIIMLAALAAVPTFAFAAQPAEAQNANIDAHTQVVSFDDLDLTSEADVRILDRRIRSAVQAACGPTSDADPAGNNDVRRCRAETSALIEARRTVAIAEARQSVRTALASQD